MANEIIITTEGDFEEGTLYDSASASEVPGDLTLTDGYGSWLSQALDAGEGLVHLYIVVEGTRPTGSAYRARFKTADTEGGLAAADWSDWFGDADANGDLYINVEAEQVNAGRTTARWMQVEAYLRH